MLALRVRALHLVCSALLAACGGTELLETSAGVCVEGQTASCDCGGGSIGVQRCGIASRYGECVCPEAGRGGSQAGVGASGGVGNGEAGFGGSGANPVAGTGEGGNAGAPFAGSGGSAGVGGAGGMPATGGFGGTPATGGSGGTSATGGSGGMPATGGFGGTPATGGSGGMGGGAPRDPEAGQLYGDCLAGGACDDGLLCISDGSSGVPMSYCTTTCGGLDAARCPRSRERPATCVLGICIR